MEAAKRAQKTAEKTAEKAHTRDSLQALSKLGELVDGRYRIVSEPPIVVPARELKAAYGMSAQDVERALHEQLRAYRATLQDDRRHLLERFEIVDMARKVVGVGGVGARRSASYSRDVTRRIPCSCRSRRPRRRCSRITCRRAATGSAASGWCMGNG